MLTLPKTATTYADRAAYCYRAVERLRLWHNEVGAKVDTKDEKALKAFREWARTEWEPRHKAACLTLHSLPGFTQQEPAGYLGALQKQSAKVALTPAETAAVASMAARLAAKTDGKSATSWDKDIAPEQFPRLNVLGEPPDPLEDFTTYTESDASSRLTVGANQIDWTALANSETAYVYKDEGANHFSGNFTHLMKALMTVTGNAGRYPAQWILSNTVATVEVLLGGTNHALVGGLDWGGLNIWLQQVLYENNGAALYSDEDNAGSSATAYWGKFVRDEAVGTYGTLYGYWYTDAGRTTLLSSQALTLHEKADFRYVYGFNNYVFANANVSSGYSADLDLGEVTQSVVPMLFNQLSMQGGD